MKDTAIKAKDAVTLTLEPYPAQFKPCILTSSILLLGFMMIIFFYRHSIKDILKTPKESFFLSIPILLMGVLF